MAAWGKNDDVVVEDSGAWGDGDEEFDPARRELPEGVKPSTAQGGRGAQGGPTAQEMGLAAAQRPGARRGTMRAVAPFQATGLDSVLQRGGPLANDKAMRAQPVPGWGEPPAERRMSDAEMADLPRQSRTTQSVAAEDARARAPEFRPSDTFVAPTGGAVEAIKAAPGMAARALGETAMTAGAVLADYGMTLPGGPNAADFRREANPLKDANRTAAYGLSDKALVDLGPVISSLVPSARDLGQGLSEVGRQVVLNAVIPGGIILDAGFKGVDEAAMAGMSPGGALLVGLLKAGTEGVPEHFSAKFAMHEGASINIGKMLADPKIAVDAVKRFGAAMGVELSTEEASAVGNWAVDRLAQDPTATLDRLGADMTDAIKGTLIQAPGMMAAGKIAASAESLGRKITAYDIAAARGFHSKPPLSTDTPDVQRTKTIAIFTGLAAEYGIPRDAVARATEAAQDMPAKQVGPFLARMVDALGKRKLVSAEVDPAIVGTLTAGPVMPAQEVTEPAKAETKQAPSETKAPTTETKAAESAPAQEEDFTGLSEPAAIDMAAHEAAPSPKNELPEPTDAQKEAGNYRLGHARIAGLDVSIENPEGSIRRSKADSPVKWETTMANHYGYIRGTVGMDGDHVDTFIKPGTPDDFDGTAFVVDQQDPKTGRPDEHKVMLGFDTQEEAQAAYLSNYQKGWKGMRAISASPMAEFKAWLKDGDTSKPFNAGAYRGPQQPDVPGTAGQPAASAAGRRVEPAGSGGTVGRGAADAGRREPNVAAPAQPRVRAPVVVRDASGAPHAVVANAGRTPTATEPLTLRPNADGTLTPHLGKNPLVDFDSGDPITMPAGTALPDAVKAIRAAGSVSKKINFYPTKTDDQNEPSGPTGTEAKATPVEAPAPARSNAPAAADVSATRTGAVEADGLKDIPRGPAGDQMMRDMPAATKQEAAVFLVAYRQWLAVNNPYGMVKPVTDKPATLRAPDLPKKARDAAETAEANYWQMPYEVAAARYDFRGLPREKWAAERIKRGLPADVPTSGTAEVKADGLTPATETGGGARKPPKTTQLAAAAEPSRELGDEEAFSNDYAAFDGKTVEQQVQVADTGQTATLRMDAAKAMRAIDARLKALRELRTCIGASA